MFCNQCEQAARGKGCTVKGVCGKTPEVAALQDLLIYTIKGLSLYAHEGRKNGVVDGGHSIPSAYSAVLVKNFKIKPITNPAEDLAAILQH